MLYCASQLSTAAAHAGEYGEFGVLPMRTFMRELEDGLASFKSLLL
jgi:hypothetical protein